jgi:integrase/recombinase XerD
LIKLRPYLLGRFFLIFWLVNCIIKLLIALGAPMSSSLFDNLDTWRTAPAKAFDSFVVSPEFLDLSLRKPGKGQDGAAPPQALRKSSVNVYRAMFGRYLRWLDAHQIALFAVTSADLFQFLAQPALTSRIKYRYLRLLDRVYAHLAIVKPNPAQHACFDIFQGDRSQAGKDQPMVVLSAEQQSAFLGALPPPTTWKRSRDRAMQALMIGAGLKVSEVIGLRVENVGQKEAATGCIPITVSPGSAGGTVRWHQTQLRAFAVPELLAWLQVRHQQQIAGLLLFPASQHGARLNPATVYRQVNATFARAQIRVNRTGGRTLRNSYAVRELTAGADIELVGEFLGHRQRRSTEYYAAAVAPADPAKADNA